MIYGHYCQFGCKKIVTVILAPKECLVAEQYYTLIWLTFVDLRLSRRELADEVTNIFRDACCVEILTASGEEYILPEFHDVFSNDDTFWWFGYFMHTNGEGNGPKHFSKKIPRLEVLDAAAKIINPAPFRAIGQIC